MPVNPMTSTVPCPASILRCPITHGRLQPLRVEELAGVNDRVGRGEMRHPDGTPVRGELKAGYRTSDGQYVYGVRDGIVLLLPTLAMVCRPPHAGDQPAAATLRQEKNAVQDFYDEVGWVQNKGGVFVDAELWEDLRDVTANYIRDCHLRVKQHLPPRGRYLLDVASGPVQYPEYVTYSEDYEARICVDLSYAALQAAQRNLGDRGIYILGDITNLPLQDNAVDAAVSLHTIYHVPADEQAQAFREVARVLQAGGRAAVVYVWKNRWIRAAMLPARLLQLPFRLGRKLFRAVRPPSASDQRPRLHFHAHKYRWFVEQEWPFAYDIRSWRSVTAAFTKCYFHRWLLGRAALSLLYRCEDAFPRAFGRFGAYPLILIDKPIAEAADAALPRAA